MNNMNNNLKLDHLINVFGVKPTFLLPVFTDGFKFYFQKIEHDIISSFSEADLVCFSECDQIEVGTSIEYTAEYTVGSPAIYAVQLPDRNYMIGTSKDILSLYYKNISILSKFSTFLENIQALQAEIGVSQHPERSNEFLINSNAIVPVIDFVEPKKQMLLNFRVLEDKYPLLITWDDQSKYLTDFFKRIEVKRNELFTLLHLDNLEAQTDEIINYIYENQSEAVYGILIDAIKAENIFHFYELIKSNDKTKHRQFSTSRTIRLKKKNICPVYSQIKVIDILLKYSPKTYARKENRAQKIKSEARSWCISSHNVVKNLWTYSQVCKLFEFPREYDFLHLGNELQSIVREWGIYIKSPIDDVSNDDSIENLSIWLNDFLESQGVIDIASDECKVFWLEIKKMSQHTYAIIAQNYFTKQVHFWIKNRPISSTVLSSFIEGLYNDINSKVSILLLNAECDNNPVNDNFAEWLSDNEDKCQFIEIPRQLNVI